jgi:hypothetical protein
VRAGAITVGLALLVFGCRFAAAQQPPAPAGAAAAVDQRLVLSTDGSTLSGGSGGGGGSATWVGSITTDAVIGAGAEYQQIANSHWTAGVVSGSLAVGQAQAKPHLYVEVHEGSGNIGPAHAFTYSLAAGGVLATLTPRLSVQLEERRIDIDTSHGNLPKFGVSFRVAPQLLASASYAYSAGGNLGTKLTTVRLDYGGSSVSALAGAVWGPAAPAVLNLFGQVVRPGPTLTEGFVGIGKPVGRTSWLLLGDYTEAAGAKRTTVTLACTVQLPARGQPQ